METKDLIVIGALILCTYGAITSGALIARALYHRWQRRPQRYSGNMRRGKP